LNSIAPYFFFSAPEFDVETEGFLVDKPPEDYLEDIMQAAYTGISYISYT